MSITTTRITIETESLTIIRRATVESRWCPECRQQVESVALQDVPGTPGSGEQIQEWITDNHLHFWRPDDQPTRLCLKSLLEHAVQKSA